MPAMPEIMEADVEEEHSSRDERDFDVLPDLIYLPPGYIPNANPYCEELYGIHKSCRNCTDLDAVRLVASDVDRGVFMYTRRLQHRNTFRSRLDPERGLQNAGPPGSRVANGPNTNRTFWNRPNRTRTVRSTG
jgi:hypothetical protein